MRNVNKSARATAVNRLFLLFLVKNCFTKVSSLFKVLTEARLVRNCDEQKTYSLALLF
jgi:hypothetical protein